GPLPERRDRVLGELAPLAGTETAEFEARVGRAVECSYRVAHRIAHPPHLPLSPLVEHELEARSLQPPHARGRREAVLELDACAEPAQGLVRGVALDIGDVHLLHPEARGR